MKRFLRVLLIPALALSRWRAEIVCGLKIKRLTKDAVWLESYLRRAGLPRAQRRAHLRKMTAATYRIAVLTNLKGDSAT